MFTTEEIFVLAGFGLVGMELFLGVQTGFDLVIIGSILILGGFGGVVWGGLNTTLVLSIVLGVGYLLFGRQPIRKKLIVATKHTNIDKLIGKSGVVIRTITPDTAGMVRFGDEDWRAVAEEVIYEKEKITIEAVEGVSLKVHKVTS